MQLPSCLGTPLVELEHVSLTTQLGVFPASFMQTLCSCDAGVARPTMGHHKLRGSVGGNLVRLWLGQGQDKISTCYLTYKYINIFVHFSVWVRGSCFLDIEGTGGVRNGTSSQALTKFRWA